MIVEIVCFFKIFLRISCIRDRSSLMLVDVLMVYMIFIIYFILLEIFVVFCDLLVLIIRRVEEMVRRNKELIMNGVNFCEFRKYEKKVVKVSCDVKMREKVEIGK